MIQFVISLTYRDFLVVSCRPPTILPIISGATKRYIARLCGTLRGIVHLPPVIGAALIGASIRSLAAADRR